MRLSVGVALVLALWNNLLVLLPVRRALHAPLTIAMAGGLVAVARSVGLSWEQLGFGRAGLGTGLLWGGAITIVVAVALALLLFVPGGARLLRDRRLDGLDASTVAGRTLLRIPFGTALPEETAFRGVLFGALMAHGSLGAAVLGSSAIFGLWHVGTTIRLVAANRPEAGPGVRGLAVAGGVLVTALGGVALALLRHRTGGVLAPIVAHAAANSLATLAGWRVARRPDRRGR